MKDCLNCSNYEPKKDTMGFLKWGCKTMYSPVAKYRCHMTTAQVQKAETDVEEYVFNTKRRY